MDQLDNLHVAFRQGRIAALLDALELCRKGATPVPAWIVDALLAKREAIATALKPPPQTVSPLGFDVSLWGGIDDRRGVELVPAGKGGRILGGRRRKELQRSQSVELQAFLAGAYRAVLAAGVPRIQAVTATRRAALEHGHSVSRRTVDRALAALELHKRRY